jgi:hypothetical protein
MSAEHHSGKGPDRTIPSVPIGQFALTPRRASGDHGSSTLDHVSQCFLGDTGIEWHRPSYSGRVEASTAPTLAAD